MALPLISDLEARTQSTFAALMWALSYPGQPQPVSGNRHLVFAAIGETVLDLETSYYTPDPALDRRLRFSGARQHDATTARYQFYPTLSVDHLPALHDAPVGSFTYPDEAATLIIGCSLGYGQTIRLSGPGIQQTADLALDGLPPGFWDMRAATLRYPLGWDLVLVAEDTLIGVPRSTTVEVL